MRYLFICLLLILPLRAADPIDGVAVLVKEEPITLYDIQQRMQEARLSRDAALKALIREKLEAQEIARRDISISDTMVRERIEQIAAQNGLSTSQLYDTVWNTEHLTSSAFKKKLEKTMLTQKLYSAIAMSALEEPGDAEMREYYRLHSQKYSHSETFDVTVYSAADERALKQKLENIMLYMPDVQSQDATLAYAQMEPRLADLLSRTKSGTFTPMLPNPKGGYVTFYLRSKSMPVMLPYAQVTAQVKEALMADEREQTLKDYFDRARLGADIKVLRLPD